MPRRVADWDYLILTAGHAAQAAAYEAQLRLRESLGLLAGVRRWLVVPDPDGRRAGSGGSTLWALREVWQRERPNSAFDVRAAADCLRGRRVLVLHAGGDARRLPAYAPCGKLFVPVPTESDALLPPTLLDRQLPAYLQLPDRGDAGQVVIASGDVLVLFDPHSVNLDAGGLRGLACRATPAAASKHGVYCTAADGRVLRFLQKPQPAEQAAAGALDRYGQTLLDIGVLQFDAEFAARLLSLYWPAGSDAGNGGPLCGRPLDFYREVCCALGSETDFADYQRLVRAAGSPLSEVELQQVFQTLSGAAFTAEALPQCGFLHFGTTRQLLDSGADLTRHETPGAAREPNLTPTTLIRADGRVLGGPAWLEGCDLSAELRLGGENVLVGVDVAQPTALPPRACVDLLPGRSRDGQAVSFLRLYGVDDLCSGQPADVATLLGRPLVQWLQQMECPAAEVWDSTLGAAERSDWNARLFPALHAADAWAQWLWLTEPHQATAAQRAAYRAAERYSHAEISQSADGEAFHARRRRLRSQALLTQIRAVLRPESNFSAAELAEVLIAEEAPCPWLTAWLHEAAWHAAPADGDPHRQPLVAPRALHSLGTALQGVAQSAAAPRVARAVAELPAALAQATAAWLAELELNPLPHEALSTWAERLQRGAFRTLHRTLSIRASATRESLRCGLRTDEIVWGRAPARLDLAGGWTDTPPYTLEHGGCVLNAAIRLNGQPPIQAYARVVPDPVIRLRSIDQGAQTEVTRLEELLELGPATGVFALVKGALALSGFSPLFGEWPADATLEQILRRFGGGLELTTVAAIPKGSGLGTSSIMGAVLLAVIARTAGRTLGQQELFRLVLRLEQAMTTGGGWQDQVGGVTGGLKLVTTGPGLAPAADLRYLPADVLDPHRNGGCTLLYYTGLTRLAKNILEHVVGRYLNRERAGQGILARLRALPEDVAAAVSRKDVREFGAGLDAAFSLNVALDAESTNPQIDAILDRVRPHLCGAKLPGAGGGGFLLLVCPTPHDAAQVRQLLERAPPNPRARFFDFDVSETGLEVSVC